MSKQLLAGSTFGLWTVLRYAGKKGRLSYWHCKCACGAEVDVAETNLIRGRSHACISCAKLKHGAAKKNAHSPEYHSWSGMKARCYNKATWSYRRYGGRRKIILE